MRLREKIYRVGFLGSMAIVTAFILLMYSTTFTIESGVIQGAVLFLIGGLVLAYIMVGFKVETFKMQTLMEGIIGTAICAGAIWIVNQQVPFTLNVGLMSEKIFSVIMGVAEECSFRLFLCTFIDKMTKRAWLAVGVSSGSWTIYHIGRYGGDMSAFFVIFMAGLFLGFWMLYSKMADGVIFAHALVNYIATP